MSLFSSLINTAHSFFSSKKAAVICILIAVFCRGINVLFVSEPERDTLILAVQSKNLLEGNGLSISKYYSAAIDTPIYDVTPVWPPGYPILLAPFLKIFDYDVYWAPTILDLIFCLAFIFLVRRIAFDLKFPAAAANILTLVAGCFDYEFISQSLPTDSPAFVSFLLGLRILLRTIQNEKFQITHLAVAALLLFLPCTFRYSYPPLSIAAFAAVIFGGWYLKKRQVIKKGLLSLAFFSILLISFFVLLKLTTGSAGYIVETSRGFFPEQLLNWAPIAPGAFINTFFTTSQIIRITGISADQAMNLLELINAVMIAGFTTFIIYLFFKKQFFKTMDPFKWFLLSGFFVSAATCVSLGYLNLTYRPQPGWWNYLSEPRYFMFVTLYLQIIFIGWSFLFSSWKKSTLQKSVVIIFSCLLFLEVTHNIYFNTKALTNFDKFKSSYSKDPDYVYFANLCSEIVRDNPDSEILVVSDGDEFFRLMALYLGQKGVFDGFNLVKSLPQINRKTILVLALYDNEIPTYQDFLSSHNAKLINSVNQANFYRVDLVPR